MAAIEGEVVEGPGARLAQYQWKVGNPGGPGRGKGTRDKISRDFLAALTADFAKHGVSAIVAMRRKKPGDYIKVIAGLLPKQIEIKDGVFDDTDDDALAAIIDAARGALEANQGGGSGSQAALEHQSVEELSAVSEAG